MNNLRSKVLNILLVLAITVTGLSSLMIGADRPTSVKPTAEKRKPGSGPQGLSKGHIYRRRRKKPLYYLDPCKR